MKRPCFLLFFFAGCMDAEPVIVEPETEVKASRLDDDDPARQTSTTTINAAELLKHGAITLPDALQREPGVSVPLDVSGVDTLVPYLQGGSKAINIRGLEGDRVRLLVDGIRQPDDSTTRTFQGSGGPGRIYFDPAVFSEINLFKSAQPGSGTLAGTVSGRTESPFTLLGPDLMGHAFKSTTSYASQNRSWNERLATAWGNGDFASSIVYSYRQGHELESNGLLKSNPSDAKSHAIVWKAVFRNEIWTLEPTIDFFRSTAFTDLDSIETDSLVGRTILATNDSERERFRLSLDLKNEAPTIFSDEVTAKLYYQTSRSENLNLQNTTFRNRVNDLSYQTDIAGLNLIAIKELENHTLSYRYEGSRSDISGSLRRTDDGNAETNLPNLAPSIVWNHALSVSDEITFGDQWIITPSLRLQHYQVTPNNTADFLEQSKLPIFDEFGRLIGERTIEAVDYDNTFLSPGIHFNYQASEALSFFGSYNLGYRNPTAEELAGVFVHPDNVSISLPNPELQAEDSHSFELGFNYETDHWNTTVSTYYSRYGNFLESNVPTGETLDGLDVLRTENTRNAEVYGVELKTTWTGEHFHGGGSFAWSQGSSDDGPLNTVEPWKAVAHLGYHHPSENWGAELSGTYVAAKSLSQISGDLPPTDSYFLLDLTGYYHLTENATLRAGVKNLLNEEYILWSRANRGGGHNGGVTNSRDTQPGINGFLSLGIEF